MQRIVSSLLTGMLIAFVTSEVSAQRTNNKNDVAAPTGIAFSYTPTELTITWSPVAGALRYELSRRVNNSTPEQLGHSDTNNFRMALPARGVNYEYQVTAVGRISYTPSAWVGYTVPLETSTTTTAVLVEPVTGGFAMTTPAGPANFTAVSPVPGQIQLSWNPPPFYTGRYKVLRSSSGGEVDREMPAPNGEIGSQYWAYRYTDAPVDFRWTYTYTIYAYVKPGATEIITAPSMASAKSLPFVQVSGLTYSLTPSTKTLGRLDVRISWNTVAGAEKYIVSDETWAAPKEFIPSSVLIPPAPMSYVQPGVPTGYTFRVCVGVAYPYNVRQDATAPCIDIKT